MSFLETPRFPEKISYGSSGGPEFRTSVVEVASGHEYRNADWQYPRWKYNLGSAIQSEAEFYEVYEFYLAVAGRLHGFRFKDHFDYKSCDPTATPTNTDQTLGAGDGSTTSFQLIKRYTKGAFTLARNILKPVDGTLLIAADGVAQGEGAGLDYTVDYTTGIVTFTTAPLAGAVLTWGGEFDVPVRFLEDYFDPVHPTYDAVEADLLLVELRSP